MGGKGGHNKRCVCDKKFLAFVWSLNNQKRGDYLGVGCSLIVKGKCGYRKGYIMVTTDIVMVLSTSFCFMGFSVDWPSFGRGGWEGQVCGGCETTKHASEFW